MTVTPAISVRIVDGPLPQRAPVASGESGAVVCFEGVVRRMEDGRPLRALAYEAYEPMASRLLTELATTIATRHALHRACVEHSRGEVGVGECSFRLIVHAGHRKPAIAAMDEFIDQMKKDVPIWKTPVWFDV